MAVAAGEHLSTFAWDEEISRDYGFIYDNKSSAFRDDLCTVWRSMCKENPQRVKKAERSSEENDCPNLEHGGKRKDLADIHHERALNAGKLGGDNGRRWRRKNYHKSKRELRKVSE